MTPVMLSKNVIYAPPEVEEKESTARMSGLPAMGLGARQLPVTKPVTTAEAQAGPGGPPPGGEPVSPSNAKA